MWVLLLQSSRHRDACDTRLDVTLKQGFGYHGVRRRNDRSAPIKVEKDVRLSQDRSPQIFTYLALSCIVLLCTLG